MTTATTSISYPVCFSLELLPPKAQTKIFSHFDPQTLCNTAQVCRAWKRASESEASSRVRQGFYRDIPIAFISEKRCNDYTFVQANGHPFLIGNLHLRKQTLRWDLNAPLSPPQESLLVFKRMTREGLFLKQDEKPWGEQYLYDYHFEIWNHTDCLGRLKNSDLSSGLCFSKILFSPEGKILICGYNKKREGVIDVWDPQSFQHLGTLQQSNDAETICLEMGKKWLIISKKGTKLWDPKTLECLGELGFPTTQFHLTVLKNGNVLSQSENHEFPYSLNQWNFNLDDPLINTFDQKFSRYLQVFELDSGIILISDQGECRLWDLHQIKDNKPLELLSFTANSISSFIALKQPGQWLAGNTSGNFFFFCLEEGQFKAKKMPALQGEIVELKEIFPGIVVSSSNDGSVKVWDMTKIMKDESPYLFTMTIKNSLPNYNYVTSMHLAAPGKLFCMTKDRESLVIKDFAAPVKAGLSSLTNSFLTQDFEVAMKQFNTLQEKDKQAIYDFFSLIMEPFHPVGNGEVTFHQKDQRWPSHDVRARAVELYTTFGLSTSLQDFVEHQDMIEMFDRLPSEFRTDFARGLWLFSGMPDDEPEQWGDDFYRKTPAHKFVSEMKAYLIYHGPSLMSKKDQKELLSLEKALKAQDKEKIFLSFEKLNDFTQRIVERSFWMLKGSPEDVPYADSEFIQQNLSDPLISHAVKKLSSHLKQLNF